MSEYEMSDLDAPATRAWTAANASPPSAEMPQATSVRIQVPSTAALPGTRPEGPHYISRPKAWAQQYEGRDRQRPQQERDSLRSRSRQGRPGSRKYKRWQHTTILVGRLRQVMYDGGEELTDTDGEADAQAGPVQRPSAFQKLIAKEGPDCLDTLREAEAKRALREPRAKSPDQRRRDEIKQVRRAFAGPSFRWIASDPAVRKIIAWLEDACKKSFYVHDAMTELEPSWTVCWDPDYAEFVTQSGGPPAKTIEVLGLTGSQRKLVHLLGRALALHTESTEAGYSDEPDVKMLTLRPPRGQTWRPAQLPVAQILGLDHMEYGKENQAQVQVQQID